MFAVLKFNSFLNWQYCLCISEIFILLPFNNYPTQKGLRLGGYQKSVSICEGVLNEQPSVTRNKDNSKHLCLVQDSNLDPTMWESGVLTTGLHEWHILKIYFTNLISW